MIQEFDQYLIRSDFDSANLAAAAQITPHSFHVHVASDAPGIDIEQKYRSWFYFCVEKGQKGNTISFTFKNLNKHSKLYRGGMKPQWRSLPSQFVWKSVSQPLRLQETDEFLEMTFRHTFEHSNEEVYFAFNFPFSFEEIQDQICRIQLYCRLPSLSKLLYFHRECVVHSIEQRPVELLTISSPLGRTDQTEPFIENLFPLQDSQPRAHVFTGKKIVFITARVHPGESPAQHVYNGFLEFILSMDARAVLLRDRFVFKLIPCLNPDGVSSGHYRSDSRGVNLNRCYTEPNRELHPSVYASKQLMLQWNSDNKRVAFFIDMHAHANKKNLFLYGNSLQGAAQVETVLFAKLLSLNNSHLDFQGCNFSAQNMNAKDRRGESREGSARVSMFLATGLTHCYTLECNYHSSKAMHILPPLPAPPISSSSSSSVSLSALPNRSSSNTSFKRVNPQSANNTPVAASSAASSTSPSPTEFDWKDDSQSSSSSSLSFSSSSESIQGSESQLLVELWKACAPKKPTRRLPPLSSSSSSSISGSSEASDFSSSLSSASLAFSSSLPCSSSHSSKYSSIPPIATVLFSEAPHFDANAPSEVGQLEYDVMKLHAMGSAVAISLADMIEVNAQSRLVRSEHKSLIGLYSWVQRYLLDTNPKLNLGPEVKQLFATACSPSCESPAAVLFPGLFSLSSSPASVENNSASSIVDWSQSDKKSLALAAAFSAAHFAALPGSSSSVTGPSTSKPPLSGSSFSSSLSTSASGRRITAGSRLASSASTSIASAGNGVRLVSSSSATSAAMNLSPSSPTIQFDNSPASSPSLLAISNDSSNVSNLALPNRPFSSSRLPPQAISIPSSNLPNLSSSSTSILGSRIPSARHNGGLNRATLASLLSISSNSAAFSPSSSPSASSYQPVQSSLSTSPSSYYPSSTTISMPSGMTLPPRSSSSSLGMFSSSIVTPSSSSFSNKSAAFGASSRSTSLSTALRPISTPSQSSSVSSSSLDFISTPSTAVASLKPILQQYSLSSPNASNSSQLQNQLPSINGAKRSSLRQPSPKVSI